MELRMSDCPLTDYELDVLWKGHLGWPKIREYMIWVDTLRKDKARLDWLEESRAGGNCWFWDYGGQCEFNKRNGRAYGKAFWDEGKDSDVREAIDAAMSDKSSSG